MKIVYLAMSLALAGCTTPLAGKWRNVQRNGSAIPRARQLTMSFESDGRITNPAADGSAKVIGKYSVKADEVSLESDGRILKYRFEMTPRTLRFQSEERKNDYLLFLRAG